MEMAYKITEVCGDWALHIPPYGKTDAEMILIFNSRNNTELVKSVLEWEDAHPNAAVPYKSTLAPPNEPLTCEGCIYNHSIHDYCNYCVRRSHVSDYYRRPPEGEEEENA